MVVAEGFCSNPNCFKSIDVFPLVLVVVVVVVCLKLFKSVEIAEGFCSSPNCFKSIAPDLFCCNNLEKVSFPSGLIVADPSKPNCFKSISPFPVVFSTLVVVVCWKNLL